MYVYIHILEENNNNNSASIILHLIKLILNVSLDD